MSNNSVTFISFCYSGDQHLLIHHLEHQVKSNDYPFDEIIIINQMCDLIPREQLPLFDVRQWQIKEEDIPNLLDMYNIDNVDVYVSDTDTHHTWRNHVVNHLCGVVVSTSDFIVFADNDCWIKSQPNSWVQKAIDILNNQEDVFIVSPGDGEGERKTLRFSQQMFCIRRVDFMRANWNQPGFSGNVFVPGGPMMEYHCMLEGRMEYYCRNAGKYRYVLSDEWRYWHHNLTNSEGWYETDYTKW